MQAVRRAALAALFALACTDGGSAGSRGRGDGGPVCAPCGPCEEAVPVGPGTHTTSPVPYADPPPAGGPHDPCWATWGVHTVAVAPEHWVHNLEHGGVVVLTSYADGGASTAATLEDLRAFVRSTPMTLLTPDATLGARFAVIAWGYRLVADCLDRDTVAAFYRAHVSDAPESVSAGPPAGCP